MSSPCSRRWWDWCLRQNIPITNNKLSMGAVPSHTRPCVRHLISHAWGFRSFPVTAPLAWAACQLQHLPRYPSLIRTAQACPPGLPTRSRRTPFPAVAAHSNRSLLGAVSVAGKRNFEARDKGAEMAVGIHLAARRDHAPARKPGNSGLFAKSREISVRRRLRGGGCSRLRTGLCISFPC